MAQHFANARKIFTEKKERNCNERAFEFYVDVKKKMLNQLLKIYKSTYRERYTKEL